MKRHARTLICGFFFWDFVVKIGRLLRMLVGKIGKNSSP